MPNWPKLISDCLETTHFMALATHGSEGLWVNPVYFAWNRRDVLYFISQQDCVHMRNIAEVPEVACAIYPTEQPTFVRGTYIKGLAAVLTRADPECELADTVYYGRIYPDDADGSQKTKDTYRTDTSWHFVKVTIAELSYFDTRHFGERRVSVPHPSRWAG